MAAQEEVVRELRHAEKRRIQAVEQLVKLFSGAQNTGGLPATNSDRVRSESRSY
jgi:hypothetical protein